MYLIYILFEDCYKRSKNNFMKEKKQRQKIIISIDLTGLYTFSLYWNFDKRF
jgi:hypothetical protein